MSDAMSVLFGLEDEFRVLEVRRVDVSSVKVIIEQMAREGPCPACGVLSGAVKDRPVMRLKDLPMSGQSVELWWRKRRLICGEGLCPRKTFTQVSAAVRPRARVTERLRRRVAMAIASGNRAVSEVAVEYRLSWPTAHKALVVAATRWLPEPAPTRRLGSMRHDSGRSAGSWMGSSGSGPIRG
jgi:transposase